MIVYKVIKARSRASAAVSGHARVLYPKGAWATPRVKGSLLMAFRHKTAAERFARDLQYHGDFIVVRCRARVATRKLFPAYLISGLLGRTDLRIQEVRDVWSPAVTLRRKCLPGLLRHYPGTVLCTAIKPLE